MLSPPINLTPRQWELGYLAEDKGAGLPFSNNLQTLAEGMTLDTTPFRFGYHGATSETNKWPFWEKGKRRRGITVSLFIGRENVYR